ncbi:hypothetical protein [Curvivirga aplysinae]|uniref:hypothetical protein n=1 Tax=Curvivirga aplysinae TaxID=2529852 RepID=UPI0012BB99C7|nr:hypothetical protein [Curvivirga aplysinae]MTI09129.1 hypothetical protein [Curvivirga aplysinae]
MNQFNINMHRFPKNTPDYAPIKDDPEFIPAKHLALSQPEQIWTLGQLGYTSEDLTHTPTDTAMSSAFRILTDEGVATLQHICRQLEEFTTSNPRVTRNTRGGSYRSRFLRDFCLSTDVAEHLSGIMGAKLLPHAMGHQLGHLNYNPLEIGEDTSTWHYDTLQVDYVLFVTDPSAVQGGEFKIFKGTREELKSIRESGQDFPEERIIAPVFPGAGYALCMQGNYVVHKAAGLKSAGERITLVNGYSFAAKDSDDFTAFHALKQVDDPAIVEAEYTRQMALRAVQHLDEIVNYPSFETDAENRIKILQKARTELDIAISKLVDEKAESLNQFKETF